jgi:fatty acid desaturase
MKGACRYRWALGKEGEGVHSLRLFDVAVVDVALTLAGGALVAAGTGPLTWIRFAAAAALLFALGIVLHRLFCVNTTFNKAIFGVV